MKKESQTLKLLQSINLTSAPTEMRGNGYNDYSNETTDFEKYLKEFKL